METIQVTRCYESRIVERYSVNMNVLACKSEKGKSGYQSLSPEAAQNMRSGK